MDSNKDPLTEWTADAIRDAILQVYDPRLDEGMSQSARLQAKDPGSEVVQERVKGLVYLVQSVARSIRNYAEVVALDSKGGAVSVMGALCVIAARGQLAKLTGSLGSKFYFVSEAVCELPELTPWAAEMGCIVVKVYPISRELLARPIPEQFHIHREVALLVRNTSNVERLELQFDRQWQKELFHAAFALSPELCVWGQPTGSARSDRTLQELAISGKLQQLARKYTQTVDCDAPLQKLIDEGVPEDHARVRLMLDVLAEALHGAVENSLFPALVREMEGMCAKQVRNPHGYSCPVSVEEIAARAALLSQEYHPLVSSEDLAVLTERGSFPDVYVAYRAGGRCDA